MRSEIRIGAEMLITELEILSPSRVCMNALRPTGRSSFSWVSGIITRRRKPTDAIMVMRPVLELISRSGSIAACCARA
jgi:hypothetical protein